MLEELLEAVFEAVFEAVAEPLVAIGEEAYEGDDGVIGADVAMGVGELVGLARTEPPLCTTCPSALYKVITLLYRWAVSVWSANDKVVPEEATRSTAMMANNAWGRQKD